MVRAAPAVPLAAALLLAAGAHALHGPAARAMGAGIAGEAPRYFLPQGAELRPFTLGQATTVSDFYWLREIQYIGTPEAEKEKWPQLLALGDLVTDLDPLHGYAYEVTGLMLSNARRLDEANRIFDKGRAAVPQRWQLPFFEAFNEYYEVGNFAKGADLLAQAARLPGSPHYVSRLASKLYSSAGEVDVALSFVESMLERPDLPEKTRADLEAQRFGLTIERDLQLLERAVAEYARRTGHRPAALADLAGTVLTRLPAPPAGSEWIYDPQAGTVQSSVQEERLRYQYDGSAATAAQSPP